MNSKAKNAPPRILALGLPFELPDIDQDNFYTDKHFLDYEIVIIDPQGALNWNGQDYTDASHNGELHLEYGTGNTFLGFYASITGKLTSFVNKGGFAIMFLRSMPLLMSDSMSPPGKGHVSLQTFLPCWKPGVHRAHGSNIEFSKQGAVGRFWQSTKGLWRYEAVYSKPPERPSLAHVFGHQDQVVADCVQAEERGLVIMTPVPNIDITLGDRQAEEMTVFIQAVRDLHEAIRAAGASPQLPDWASDYSLPGELELKAKISDANSQIEILQKQVRERTEELNQLCLHKLLVTGYDSALEGAVDRILTDLGLKVEPGPKGRVDRTATYGDRKLAIEVQGVKRGAKEDHVRALTIWVQDVAIQDGQEPKGILVENPYRDTPLAERGGHDPWPGNTIEICERQGHCAITGLQLLGLYLDAMADNTKRDQLIEKLFSTKGKFEGYEDWSKFLAPVESNTPKKC